MSSPDPASPARLLAWQQLLEPAHAALLAAAREVDPGDVAAVARLRKLASPELVHLSLDLCKAGRKLAGKWSERSEQLVADPHGAEMASSHAAAAHKARRFAEVLGSGAQTLDLCCGIGGDAMGLTAAGLQVLGVDADPVRAWMCGRNAGCQTRACDVSDASLPSHPFHLDPARRDSGSGKRLFSLDDHQPAPDVWLSLLERHSAGAIKLGPGLDAAALDRILPPGTRRELEFISERGRLTQAVLWLGPLARSPSRHTATLLVPGQAHTLTGPPTDPPPLPPPPAAGSGALPGRFLIEADGSVERARLLGLLAQQHALHELHPGLGLLTGDAAPRSPFCTSFEILEQMPWIEKHIRTWLHGYGAGIVEVKTRAAAVEPDSLQLRLRGQGDAAYTLFVLRLGHALTAYITRRPRPAAR